MFWSVPGFLPSTQMLFASPWCPFMAIYFQEYLQNCSSCYFFINWNFLLFTCWVEWLFQNTFSACPSPHCSLRTIFLETAFFWNGCVWWYLWVGINYFQMVCENWSFKTPVLIRFQHLSFVLQLLVSLIPPEPRELKLAFKDTSPTSFSLPFNFVYFLNSVGSIVPWYFHPVLTQDQSAEHISWW